MPPRPTGSRSTSRSPAAPRGGPRAQASRGRHGKNSYFAWKPNAADYGQFVHRGRQALRRQVHAPGPSPRRCRRCVSGRSSTSPTSARTSARRPSTGHACLSAPMMYRSMVNAGWKALHATGHGHDTILIGEFAARGHQPGADPPARRRAAGQLRPDQAAGVHPHPVLRRATNYQPAARGAAQAVGCPTNAAGSRRFRAPEPGAVQRQRRRRPPLSAGQLAISDGRNDPNFAEFPDLGNFARVLDDVNRAYGSHKRYPIYNTEYGYITHPPRQGPSLRVAGHRGLLHQLGRVPELEEPAGQVLHAVPAHAIPRRAPAPTPASPAVWRPTGVRPRRLLRLPDAVLHAADLVLAQPERRGLGRCPRPRRSPASTATGRSASRSRRSGRRLQDAQDGQAEQARRLLRRRR